MNRINLTFDLSWQAEALLKTLEYHFECHILDTYDAKVTIEDLDPIEIRTFPLYNCRERGICLIVDVRPHGAVDTKLMIFFAENRNSDALFVQWQEAQRSLYDPPCIDDFSDESYECSREHFGCGEFIKAAEFICNMIGRFHKKRTEDAA